MAPQARTRRVAPPRAVRQQGDAAPVGLELTAEAPRSTRVDACDCGRGRHGRDQGRREDARAPSHDDQASRIAIAPERRSSADPAQTFSLLVAPPTARRPARRPRRRAAAAPRAAATISSPTTSVASGRETAARATGSSERRRDLHERPGSVSSSADVGRQRAGGATGPAGSRRGMSAGRALDAARAAALDREQLDRHGLAHARRRAATSSRRRRAPSVTATISSPPSSRMPATPPAPGLLTGRSRSSSMRSAWPRAECSRACVALGVRQHGHQAVAVGHVVGRRAGRVADRRTPTPPRA